MSAGGAGAVLVTGATGFIGASFVRRLLAKSCDVHIMVRPDASCERLTDMIGRLSPHRGDVTDLASLIDCVQSARPETIFHFAGDTSARQGAAGWAGVERALAVNLHGTLNMLRAAESATSVKTFVRLSGLAEYGQGPTPSHETQREQPLSAYAASQTAATHWSQMLQGQLRFSLLTLRLALTYGADQSADFFIPGLIDSILRGTKFSGAAGRQGRDLVYVDDVVAAIEAAWLRADSLRGAVINISSGQNVPMREVADLVVELLGADKLHSTDPEREGDIERMSGATALAADLLGWRATTSLREGLELTIKGRRQRNLQQEARS